MNKSSKIYVAGIHGMVGSAIARELKQRGYNSIIGHSSNTLDLTNQAETFKYFKWNHPEYVFLAAAKVGGIHANNTYPGDFIYSNLCIQNNIIHSAYLNGVKKLLFLGSSCIYPKYATQPMTEDQLLTSELEPTNEPYAVAKIAGIKMCQSYNRQYGTDFISCMPTNLYGVKDNYDEMNSHVLPGLIRRFHAAKIAGEPAVTIWGDGSPKREFLYVDDLAQSCVFLMENHSGNDIVNVGSGIEVTIGELAEILKEVIGYQGNLKFDTSMPNGTPRKLLDCSKINNMGWKAKTSLKEGIEKAYAEYKERFDTPGNV